MVDGTLRLYNLMRALNGNAETLYICDNSFLSRPFRNTKTSLTILCSNAWE